MAGRAMRRRGERMRRGGVPGRALRLPRAARLAVRRGRRVRFPRVRVGPLRRWEDLLPRVSATRCGARGRRTRRGTRRGLRPRTGRTARAGARRQRAPLLRATREGIAFCCATHTTGCSTSGSASSPVTPTGRSRCATPRANASSTHSRRRARPNLGRAEATARDSSRSWESTAAGTPTRSAKRPGCLSVQSARAC